jgi:arabinogalactan oligomer/maltooligosaccharide transport system permease protein
MKFKKKKVNEFVSPYTVSDAMKKGDAKTKGSFVIMGLGLLTRHRYVKGLIYLGLEVLFIIFMAASGLKNLANLPGLGSVSQHQVWNEAKGIYEYTAGDNSLLMLLYGIATLFVVAGFVLLWRSNVKSNYKAQLLDEEGKHLNTFKQDVAALFDGNLQNLLLAGPVTGVLIFTILPLVFMISMAFTNYSIINNHLILFDWVGLKNFVQVLNMHSNIGQEFWSVLAWTLVWAIFATFLNYLFGMLLAILINRKETHAKAFWRFCFVLSIAVPQFVSLLIMRTMLQPAGAVNVLLQNAGLISNSLPFFTNTTWARVTVIVINLWVGIPYTILQVTGILQNIPAELYESAKIDGASPFYTFIKITLPYMLFVTTPYLITQFTGNVNNFNVIYLLSGGDPTPVGGTAGKTDLLVTWLYKLTIDKQYYNIGAVIGILTFIVLAIVALITYRNTGSYKNEEGFM